MAIHNLSAKLQRALNDILFTSETVRVVEYLSDKGINVYLGANNILFDDPDDARNISNCLYQSHQFSQFLPYFRFRRLVSRAEASIIMLEEDYEMQEYLHPLRVLEASGCNKATDDINHLKSIYSFLCKTGFLARVSVVDSSELHLLEDKGNTQKVNFNYPFAIGILHGILRNHMAGSIRKCETGFFYLNPLEACIGKGFDLYEDT